MKKIIYLLILTTTFLSCSSSSNKTPNFDAENEADIIKYIADNNLTAKKSNSGLYYVVENEGIGNNPVANSKVTVAYKGYYLNGKTFDKSDDKGISFNLQQVIAGWTEGITYFKEGGNGVLLVPSKLGYGAFNNRGIPGGSVLIFDIKLLKVH